MTRIGNKTSIVSAPSLVNDVLVSPYLGKRYSPIGAGPVGWFDSGIVHSADGLANLSRRAAFCERPVDAVPIDERAWGWVRASKWLDQEGVLEEATSRLAVLEAVFAP